MYRDVVQWSKIRHRILVDGISRRQVVRETGISSQTVSKMLAHTHPQPHAPRRRNYRKLGPHVASIHRMLQENATLPPTARLSVRAIYEHIRDEEGFRGGYSTVKDYARPMSRDKDCIWEHTYDLLVSLDKKRAIDLLFLLSRAKPSVIYPGGTKQFFREAVRVMSVAPKPDRLSLAQRARFDWMRALLQKEIDADALRREIGDVPHLARLLHHLYNGRLSDRNRSMVVLASRRRGLSQRMISTFLGIDRQSCSKYLRTFERGGITALFARQTKSTRKFDDEATKKAVFGLLHEPPSNYGINRTTWIMADLSRVLRETGRLACPEVIRMITKAAGYRWRKARIVLTSNDPAFSEKLDRIRSILSELRADEAFFSIDEYGPFAVKMKPGMTLTAPGKQRVVPQWQKSRGCLILTAALELSGNQVTSFYSTKKNTAEMIRMMEMLIDQYRDRRKLYLSWDAASWHISKQLYKSIELHNAAADGPIVETAPLPSGAQFLNVIESVFSGMTRAIIHNSDYKTLDDAKLAINRYFEERNSHFKQHPQRAGKKIWRNEREPAEFSPANNCKDPRYR
jgi:transposase